MAGEAVLGIDIGTTSVKAAVIGADGRVRAEFGQSYPTHRPGPGQAEQDPADWLRLVEAAMESFAGEEIAAIGLTSQVNTHLFTDAAGHPLMPAILWQDTRARDDGAALEARTSPEERTRWWGAPMPIDASHALSRMAWTARNRPEIWARTAMVMLPKDYCLAWLTGEVASDPLSNIGLVGPDLAYAAEAMALVPGAAERLVPLRGVTEVAGRVQRGPFRGVPVVTGAMDAWAGLVGTGGAREGATVYLSGTSEILGISARSVTPTPGAIVFPECEGLRLHAAPTQSGGDAAKWFAETSGLTLDEMSALVASGPRSAATPLFLPQLEGERAPLWDGSLRAAFLGLTRRSNRADLARAVFEGVALSARHALDVIRRSSGVASDRILCGGGGFRSAEWAQIRADVMGVPMVTLQAREPGVLGAAMLAGIGTGLFPGFDEAGAALIRPARTFQPDAERHRLYSELFALYTEAIAANAPLGRRLGKLG